MRPRCAHALMFADGRAPAGQVASSAMTILNADQAALRDAVHELAQEKVAPRAADIDQSGEFPWDIVELLAAHDFFAAPFPEEYGGLGADMISSLLVIEELSRVCATSGLIPAVQELGSLPLLHGGTTEQKSRWLPELAAGKVLAAFALTEAGAGSDAASMRTRATRDGDEWLINGEKRFISQGDVAGPRRRLRGDGH